MLTTIGKRVDDSKKLKSIGPVETGPIPPLEPSQELPKKRGRPKGKGKKVETIEFDKMAFYPFVQLGSDFLEKRKGEVWKMSANEVDQFSGALAKIAMKYSPALVNWQEEIGLLIISMAYYLRCVYTERASKKNDTPENRSSNPDTGKTGQGENNISK